jgi:two-component system sensor histidine kinase KdpD
MPSANLAMIYLTGVVIVAARLGLGPSLLASLLSVAVFNFVFSRPYYSFAISDPNSWVTLGFMLVASLLVGPLTAQLSDHVQMASRREHETRMLYDLTRALAAERDIGTLCDTGLAYLAGTFEVAPAIVLRTAGGLDTRPETALKDDLKALQAVNWVLAHRSKAGLGIAGAPSAEGLYLPLLAENEGLGVLALMSPDDRVFTRAEILQFETFASLIAGAIQRARRADQAEQSKVESENEKLRNILLSSLSHDLRTPLTVMNGSVSSLLRMRKDLPRRAMDELTALWTQLTRLQRFVGNLLDMAAITSGRMKFNFQPYTIQEIIGAAITHVEAGRGARTIRTHMTGPLPMVRIDGALVEQVLVNLLENAFQHTAPDGEIMITARRVSGHVRVQVSDNGPGLKPGDEARIFEQFQTGQKESSDRGGGTGLGLAICRGIVSAHGGMIYARNNLDAQKNVAGASFIFTLPLNP